MLCEKLTQDVPFTAQGREGVAFSLHNLALDLGSNQAALFLIHGDKQILIAELARNIGGLKSVNINLDFEIGSAVTLLPKGGSIHIIGAYKSHQGANAAFSEGNNKNTTRTQDNKQMVCQSQQAKKGRKNTSQERKQTDHAPDAVVNPEPASTQPLRRSTRARAVVPQPQSSAKAERRQKQALKNMAKIFDCDQNDLDDESSESFEKGNQDKDESSSESESDQSNEEEQKSKSGRKRRVSESKQSEVTVHPGRLQIDDAALSFPVPTRNPYN